MDLRQVFAANLRRLRHDKGLSQEALAHETGIIARAQPALPLPGDVADGPRLVLLPQQQLAAEPSREAVAPGSLDQQPASRAVAGLGDAAAFDARAARMFGLDWPRFSGEGLAQSAAIFSN